MKKHTIKVGSDFSGVGAFNQALRRLGIDYEEVFACDMDKYARQTFIHNYGEPNYYPTNVYDREIPKESLDIYMTSPPCQAFSLAGKRKGEQDERGILFYNSHEFIKKNKPRYFIFENVKGLLSDDNGKTFQTWLDYLGGKSINGQTTIFKNENAVDYHIYWQVLNAKNYGVPQNRERVFIVGIRDDADNRFNFPKPFPLEKRLKDVLESEVDEKYYLSDEVISGFIEKEQSNLSGNLSGGKWDKMHESARRVYNIETYSPTLHTMQGGNLEPKIKVKSATTKGYEVAETRRGRVGKKVAQTLTTSCNQGVAEYQGISVHPFSKKLEFDGFKDRPCPTLLATDYKAPKCVQFSDYRIRKLTPRECFRLMDFPEDFDFTVVSDSQAYKQAGNSIVVNVLAEVIKKLVVD